MIKLKGNEEGVISMLLEINDTNIRALASAEVSGDLYQKTEPMLWNLLKAFPENKEPYQIASKILMFDKLYSTQLFRYTKLEFLPQLVENIRTIPDFDARVAVGDPTVVCEIYCGMNKKLFSFATKYCCLHNTVIYGRDDYSIYDSAVRKLLPKYAKTVGVKLTGAQIDRWYKEDNYEAFNKAVDEVLDAAEVMIENRKRKFDLFLWSQR